MKCSFCTCDLPAGSPFCFQCGTPVKIITAASAPAAPRVSTMATATGVALAPAPLPTPVQTAVVASVAPGGAPLVIPSHPAADYHYANFFVRFVALLVDEVVVGALIGVISIVKTVSLGISRQPILYSLRSFHSSRRGLMKRQRNRSIPCGQTLMPFA